MKKRDVGSLHSLASLLFGEAGVCSVVDNFMLPLLDKWRREGKLNDDDSQYLELSMSKIIDTKIVSLYEMPSSVSNFIQEFNEKAKSSSYKDLIVYIRQTAAVVWSEDDEELKNVTDIYEYL
ncbi:unnamed protein product [Mucor hiemalis]